MSSQTVARRYATALADVLLERGEAREVQDELLSWERMIDSSETLKEVIANPTIPTEQKARVLEELTARTKVRPTTANFLRVLLRNQRLTELHEINKKLAQIVDERTGIVGAHVLSARPVPESVKQSLMSGLTELTGKRVRLSFATDETLIGGLVTRIGSTIYDGSIRNQLQLLGQKLAGE